MCCWKAGRQSPGQMKSQQFVPEMEDTCQHSLPRQIILRRQISF